MLLVGPMFIVHHACLCLESGDTSWTLGKYQFNEGSSPTMSSAHFDAIARGKGDIQTDIIQRTIENLLNSFPKDPRTQIIGL